MAPAKQRAFEQRQLGRVLVVDDSDDNRFMLQRTLSRRGHDVAAAADGPEALSRLEQEPFDLVLLDITMPGMDGFEVLRRIRQRKSAYDLPVIMVTGSDRRKDIVKALGTGANDYVVKPLDFIIVSARIHVQLSLKRARDELDRANRRMRQDLRAAAEVQHDLLPVRLPNIPGFAFAWRYLPCEHVGGDALGLVPIDADKVGVYVLDVSGHGVPAALLSVRISRHLVEGPESGRGDPEDRVAALAEPLEMVRRLNRLYPMTRPSRHFFTLLYGVLDIAEHSFRYVSAGHPGPTVVRGGQRLELNDATGIPVGVLEDAEFEEESLTLAPGDRMYLYSDGAFEVRAAGGKTLGREAFNAWLLDPQTALDDTLGNIERRLMTWGGLRDDVSLVAIEHQVP